MEKSFLKKIASEVVFSDGLWSLDVGGVSRETILSVSGPRVCFSLSVSQHVQLALIIWQVANAKRLSLPVECAEYQIYENLCTTARNVFKKSLYPYIDTNRDEQALAFGKLILERDSSELLEHLSHWKIGKIPRGIWVDVNVVGNLFLCEREGIVYVGLSPTNFVFYYESGVLTLFSLLCVGLSACSFFNESF